MVRDCKSRVKATAVRIRLVPPILCRRCNIPYTGDLDLLTKEFIGTQLEKGKSLSNIARKFDYSISTVSGRSRRFGLKPNTKPGPKGKKAGEGCYGHCAWCGKPLTERAQRSLKYCNMRCFKECRTQKQRLAIDRDIDKWERNEWTNKKLTPVLRTYIMAKVQNWCQLCGWDMVNLFSGSTTLHVHHKDGNSTNHKKENIIVICPNCHSLTKTYCGLNNKKK